MIPTELYQGQPAATETVMYTVPAGPPAQRLLGVELVLCNTDSVARAITIHWRRGGVAAAVTNRILSARLLDANATIIVNPSGTVLAAGGIISGFASVAGTITVTLSGLLEAV